MSEKLSAVGDMASLGARHDHMRATLYGVIAAALVGVGHSADARITQLQITSQTLAFGGMSFGAVGQYETLVGRASGEVDPNDPINAVITDVQLAPRNVRGMVEYSMDVVITKPVDMSKGNGTILHDVPNRGAIRSPGNEHRRRCEQPRRRLPRNPGLHAGRQRMGRRHKHGPADYAARCKKSGRKRHHRPRAFRVHPYLADVDTGPDTAASVSRRSARQLPTQR